MAGNRTNLQQRVDAVIVKQPMLQLMVEFNGQQRPIEVRLGDDGKTLQYGNDAVHVRVVGINGKHKVT